MTEASVPSPCINVCSLDENDICVGCYRSATEITDWTEYDNEKKLAVRAAAMERAKKMFPGFG